MNFVALNCPQCAAPLPRVALWRAVKCGSCGALITKTESIVTRDTFRQALKYARQDFAGMGSVTCGGARFHLMHSLGNGETSQVYFARRAGALPYLVVIKLSSAPSAATRLAREAQVLRELQALDDGMSGVYFSRLLPEVIAQGVTGETSGQHALVLRYPSGFWGSLAALSERFPTGLDPRHAVWIWRRMLEVLNFIHRHDWAHGDIRPEHALVHPQDHGIRLIGWALAQKGASMTHKTTDLMRSARVVQVLLCGAGGSGVLPGTVPAGLAELVTRAAHDEEFCRAQGAEGIDTALRAEAKAAFGPPAFVPLAI